jgi:mono/diheme cytochrome c family protein
MYRLVAPLGLLAAVTAAAVALALWQPFTPTAPGAPASGDPARGETVFATSCAGCHGSDATGGIAPSLVGRGLTTVDVEAIVAAGRGVKPAGVVEGQDAADVPAYVATLSQ